MGVVNGSLPTSCPFFMIQHSPMTVNAAGFSSGCSKTSPGAQPIQNQIMMEGPQSLWVTSQNKFTYQSTSYSLSYRWQELCTPNHSLQKLQHISFKLTQEHKHFTLLSSTSLNFTLLYSTLLYFTQLYSTLLYFTLHYSTLLFFTLLYTNVIYFTHIRMGSVATAIEPWQLSAGARNSTQFVGVWCKR